MYNLGEKGRSWTKRCLTSGLVLSQSVLASLDIEAGDTVLLGFSAELAPSSVSKLCLSTGFNNQVILSLKSASEELFSLIRQIADRERNLMLVVEDDIRRPGDAALDRKRYGQTKLIQQSVYHFADVAAMSSSAELTQFISESASGYPLNAFLMSMEIWYNLQSNLSNSTSALSATLSVNSVINTAFDYESYAVWLPTGYLPDLPESV